MMTQGPEKADLYAEKTPRNLGARDLAPETLIRAARLAEQSIRPAMPSVSIPTSREQIRHHR